MKGKGLWVALAVAVVSGIGVVSQWDSIRVWYLVKPGADLQARDFSGCDLRGLDLRSANLGRANLSNTDLSKLACLLHSPAGAGRGPGSLVPAQGETGRGASLLHPGGSPLQCLDVLRAELRLLRLSIALAGMDGKNAQRGPVLHRRRGAHSHRSVLQSSREKMDLANPRKEPGLRHPLGKGASPG